MVAYIKRLAVEHRRWLSEDDFRLGLALCQAIPGATAMQTAGYVGLRARGLRGAVAAYCGFGLPAFVLMLTLALAYERAVGLAAVASALAGLRALVVALVAHAAWSFARLIVASPRAALLAAATAALFLAGISPFLIVLTAGLAGALLLKGSDTRSPENGADHRPGWRAVRSPLVVLAVAGIFLAVLAATVPRLASLAAVMMRVDLFAFGGGFTSVPLMYHEVVEAHRWMPASEFLDGIALGQVTPGPIVITATFVGQRVAALPGALVATAAIFLPSLLVLLLVEPWFRALRSSRVFTGITRGLLLSFVGLLASIALHFVEFTPWSVPLALIAGLGLVALLFKVDVVLVVLAGAAISALLL
jgi:chromate transporter